MRIGGDKKLERAISTGAAYSQGRDTREFVGLVYTLAFGFGAAACAAYATAAGRWSTGAAVLVAGLTAAAIAAAALPWGRLPKSTELSLFWALVTAIISAVYIFDLASLSLLMVVPMMTITYLFWRRRELLISQMLLAMCAFALPAITGEADAALNLIVTMPLLVAVATLGGVLADRFQSMRQAERGRYKATIEALSTALTARDGYTGSHSQETLWFVRAVCDELGLDATYSDFIADVALLHDIGKIGISNDVLHEPGRLDESQWKAMRQHPEIGERIVATIPGLEEVARAIRHEHEHWDGSGYPDGLRQGAIPLASRIVLACDALHAMTSDRPYREAMTLADARQELARNAGTQFDPIVVGALLRVLDRRGPEFDESEITASLGAVVTPA